MKKSKVFHRLYRSGIQLMAVGIFTGICAGIVVTFFNLAAKFLSSTSKDIYASIRENPAFVPLLFLTLVIIAFGVAVVQKLIPMVRGSGIPQTEGASRGLMELKWYQSLPAMTALTLVCIFSGMTAGAEGPSMFIGACCGEGVGRVFRSTEMERRYQLTGGACAGLAVAFNAPLTGIVFAFEEAHRRFTPAIFICAFSSVLSGVITRHVLFDLLNMPITTTFTSFKLAQMPLSTYGYVALSAVLSGVIGVIFYVSCLHARKLFSKIKFARGMGKILIPFAIAGCFGLISVAVMGGGTTFVQSLGTNGGETEMAVARIFSTPVVVTLLLVVIMRLIATITNVGAGVPCGIFIPMLAIGASIGALLSKLCGAMGMDSVYCDCIVMICMATFFSSVVKAPITAIIMVIELTGQFTLLIPIILGVSIGYMISEVFSFKPLYEELLEEILQENHVEVSRYTYTTVLETGSVAEGKAIRDILWPGNLLIRTITRNGAKIVPASDTVLEANDEITAQAECIDYEKLKTSVDEIVKQRPSFLAKRKQSKKSKR